jgi:dTDP-glucose 4,6-dehydratase
MTTHDSVLVTGGAGFIGSNFVLEWLKNSQTKVINLDLLTYAGNLSNLQSLDDNNLHHFVQGDIADKELIPQLLKKHQPKAIINFAAESHVDRSITGPEDFIQTNILGTYNFLQSALEYYNSLDSTSKQEFRFLHVSTDEVYGSLEEHDPAFTEESRYQPNSPYSASKASSDHLVRAWYHTYNLPTIITNCSNNYGPYQFPEKLIPLVISNALAGKELPIYGNGKNIRDWLFVTDHCDAIRTILQKGQIGENYNIGGNNEKSNIEVVTIICSILDTLTPPQNIAHPKTGQNITSYAELISFVQDRAGHDKRYAINPAKIQKEFNWFPKESFETGIAKTVEWYINNPDWVANILTGEYRK